MKMISLAAIGLGVICLIVSVVEHFAGANLLRIEPIKYVEMASAMFLFAVAAMCYGRFYGSVEEKK